MNTCTMTSELTINTRYHVQGNTVQYIFYITCYCVLIFVRNKKIFVNHI